MFRKFLLLTTAMTIFQGGALFAQGLTVNGEPLIKTEEKKDGADADKPAALKDAESGAKTEEGVQSLDDSINAQVNTKEREVLLDRVVNMASKLDKAQASHFFVMYANYSIISLVNNVEKDVGEAVQKCGDANPDMKSKIDSRFVTWKEAVGKARVEAVKNVDNMASAQDYAPKAELDEIFGMVDKTRIEADTRFQRIPVSTPEACEFMLTKMDESQQTMDQLLRTTVASYPNLLKKNQE